MYEPLATEPDIEIVGVSDVDRSVADRVAGRLRCPVFYDHQELLDAAKPDLVYAHDIHAQMATLAGLLIAARVPFVIEKPVGLDTGTVEALARAAADAGVYCDIPFVYRMAPWIEYARQRAQAQKTGPRVHHAHFKLIAGPPTRYIANGVDWMLDPVQAGGGCTINLSVHFIDLFAMLVDEPVKVRTAALSHHSFHLPVEDYSTVTLESESGALATIETGYTQPTYGQHRLLDFGCTMRTPTDYYQVGSFETMTTDVASSVTTYAAGPTINRTYYPQYARDVVKRVRDGAPPLASLWDMARTMRLLESAYRIARQGDH
jgi:predicted dehydrogenase